MAKLKSNQALKKAPKVGFISLQDHQRQVAETKNNFHIKYPAKPIKYIKNGRAIYLKPTNNL